MTQSFSDSITQSQSFSDSITQMTQLTDSVTRQFDFILSQLTQHLKESKNDSVT